MSPDYGQAEGREPAPDKQGKDSTPSVICPPIPPPSGPVEESHAFSFTIACVTAPRFACRGGRDVTPRVQSIRSRSGITGAVNSVTAMPSSE